MARFFLLLLLCFQFSIVLAIPLTEDKTPDPLKPWLSWVLQNEESYQCPFFYNDFKQKQCSWPGKLKLELNAKQASFSSQWQVYKESWISLPGNQKIWPQNVSVNNEPALVIIRQGKPAIKLAGGAYKIKGEFFWDRIPESLAIPKNTGLFSLHINGKNIPYPTIKGDLIWLKESDRGDNKPKSVENKLDLQVFRKVDDTIPLQLITFLELDVSGDQREISLPHALLAEFIPIALKSPLPAKIEPDGSLLIQVRPGRWHIELNARHPDTVTQLTFNVKDEQWPQSEIWSFNAQPFLRVVEIDSLKTIDPSQTNVPKQWKSLPAYFLNQGDSMRFNVIRRGDPEPEPNQLSLKRQLWLDFNGEAYTVSDTIKGKMTKGWRLNAIPDTRVGQVKLNGKNQLVTLSSGSNRQGVEVRKGNIVLQADSRISGDISAISAVGWEQNFHQVQAELNIPPGWRLLAASGVDNVPNSWISLWTLLDLFLVLIASLAISRLWTVYWGIFALITLGLCWHEAGAPQFIWLNILAAIALIRVIPVGKFRNLLKWYRNICWISLLVIAIPFMVSQVRIGLYPQLERQWQQISPAQYSRVDALQSIADMEMLEGDKGVRKSLAKRQTLASPSSMTYGQGMNKTILRIDPDANIQTGPGLPQWQWKKIRLSWNGSVDNQQQISFWYLSPTITMLLNFLRVLLVLVLSLLLFDLANKKLKLPSSLLSCLLLISLFGMPVESVYADFPEQKLLDDLKSRLLQAPECLPACAQISQMDLSINKQQLNIKLQVHAQQSTAIPLPAQLKQWLPNQVKIDGNIAQALIRSRKGLLWLSLEKGLHTIEMQGITPAQNKFSLPLPLKPHRTTIVAQGWNIEGLHEDGRTDNQLLFDRLKTVQKQQGAKQKLEPGVLPPFIRIERTLQLGLDWRINTRVVRLVNNDSAVALSIPLLTGESVTTANTRVKDKHVLINLSSRQNSVQWESVLKKSSQIELIAAKTKLWTEIWRVDVSPTWHIQSSGIAVVHHQDRGRWLPEWHPWPGEKVSLAITRPEAVKGATLTIDKTELQIKPGKRSIETELKLSIRSSKGTQHTLTLPEQVQLQSVIINGITQPVRQKGMKVTLPIKPGKQEITLNWRKMQEQSTLMSTPSVNLDIASVNNHIKVLLGRDRWVLFTSGPSFGPAVLIWGVLIVLVLLSFGLGKIPVTPLKQWHWLLLLVGLSQIPVAMALIVVVWLIALGLRAKNQPLAPGYFNTMQIGLVLLTLLSLVLLFMAVQQGLLGTPDMQISGNQSTAFNLNWYQDRSNEQLSTAIVCTVPLMTYRVLMLLWSLWLAVSLLNWLKWGWTCFSTDGLWKKKGIIEKS